MSCECDKDMMRSKDAHEKADHSIEDNNENRKRDKICIAISVAFLAASFLCTGMAVRCIFLGISYLAVGAEVVFRAIKGIIARDFFDEETLMSIATIGAAAVGDYTEAVAVMLFYRIGEMVQDLAVDRSRERIASAVALHPEKATVERNGERLTVDPDTVSVGETLIIGVGERIPLDGAVTCGSSRLDCSSLTGESNSVRVEPGDRVFAGSVNLVSEIRITATALSEDSASFRLLKAIEEASETKPKLERFITRFSRIYTPCVVGLALAVAVLPPVFGLGSFREWIHRALTFLVISCPCALVLSIPLTFFSGLGVLTKHELLPKSADAIERLAGIKAIAFDKTGTLTTGSFSVLSVTAENMTEEELVDYAAMAERNSPHPIASAITSASARDWVADETREHIGKGVTARKGNTTVAVGNEKLFKELGIPTPEAAGGVLVSVNGTYAGCIEVGDTPKESAIDAVEAIKVLGIEPGILTGDNESAARSVAEKTGIASVVYGLLPEEKTEKLRELRNKYGSVAFVGDGMNDAPVLRNADVGIAMADRGVELAAESADILLLSGNLRKIPLAIKFARRTMHTAKANVALALGVKTIAMVLSALGLTGMWIAVVADSGAALLCVLIALTVFRAGSNIKEQSPEK